MEERRSASKILTGKRPSGRPRWRWKDNIKMYINKYISKLAIGVIWLRIVTTGVTLGMQHCASRSHKPLSLLVKTLLSGYLPDNTLLKRS